MACTTVELASDAAEGLMTDGRAIAPRVLGSEGYQRLPDRSYRLGTPSVCLLLLGCKRELIDVGFRG
jgi:hypothetical protein